MAPRTPYLVLTAILLLATSRPLWAEGRCMYPSWVGSTVYAIDAKTGKVREIARPGLRGGSRPALFRGVLYLGEPDNLVALDADSGKILWGARTGYGQIVPTEDTLFVGGWPRAVDRSTGKVRWKAECERGSWNILLTPELVICTLNDKDDRNPRVAALERKTGQERWRFALKARGASISWLTPSLASEDLVLVGGEDEGYLLDLKSGREVWSFRGDWPTRPQSTLSSPRHVIGTGSLVVRFQPPGRRTDRGSLQALDVATRKPRWQTPLPGPIDWSANLAAAGGLVFLAQKDSLFAFGARDGKLQWQVQGLQASVQMEAAKEGGTVYVLDSASRLQALDEKSGKSRYCIDLKPKESGMRYLSSQMSLAGTTLYVVATAYFDPRWEEKPRRPGNPR